MTAAGRERQATSAGRPTGRAESIDQAGRTSCACFQASGVAEPMPLARAATARRPGAAPAWSCVSARRPARAETSCLSRIAEAPVEL